jgi:hypothetical protein
VTAEPPGIERCPTYGLWLLPAGGAGEPADRPTRWLPGWHDLAPMARQIVLPAVVALHEQDRRAGRPAPEVRLLPCTFGLLPLPDHPYSSLAVAVIAPEPGSSRLDPARQIAWVKQDHLASLQPSVVALAEASGEAVGCRGLIEVHRHAPGLDYDPDGPDDPDDPDDVNDGEDGPSVLSAAETRCYGYEFAGFRADIDSWQPVREAVLAWAAPRIHDRILPLVARSSRWSPQSRPVREQIQAASPVEVELRADAEHLDAYWNGLLISRLHPDARAFFARTHQRVRVLGGQVSARAIGHHGSVEMLVEDDRPLVT